MTYSSVIGLASDHAGYELKQWILTWFERQGLSFIDYGTDSVESVDYPIYGHKLAEAIENGEISIGIGICGSGNGMNMTLNKHPKVRSALCWNEEIVRLARMHNDANALVFPARFLLKEAAQRMVEVFLKTPFEGGRHQQRIKAIPYL